MQKNNITKSSTRFELTLEEIKYFSHPVLVFKGQDPESLVPYVVMVHPHIEKPFGKETKYTLVVIGIVACIQMILNV